MKQYTEQFQLLKEVEYYEKIVAYETTATTSQQKARAQEMRRHLASTSDGRFGCIDELLSTTDKSSKVRVSKQGKADTAIKWRNEQGKVTNRPAERKTNGGRIGEMIDRLAKGKDTLVIYSLDICNSNTKGKRRIVEPVIIPFSVFYNCLIECNALKQTNGEHNEFAIQVTSKKLYDRLLDYPIPYEPNTIYCADDFEDIEL